MQTYNSAKSQSWLSWFLKGLLVLGTLVLLGRLAELQIIKGEYYNNLSEGNRIRRITRNAPRGKILARGGETIVDNTPIKKEIQFRDNTIEINDWERKYLFGADLAHITGYISEVNEEEVGKVNPACPQNGARLLGSAIGRSGLEQQYNCTLEGINGEELVEVDSLGRKVRILGRKDPLPGGDVKTTIDLKLQRRLAQAMEGKIGAAIITDTSGEVLALFSSPSYDPANIKDALTDSSLPLFNRAISGVYHPGSIFKIVTSVGALEEKAIEPDFTYTDTGQIVINDFSYTNWYFTQNGGVEGEIGLEKAIARSTDTFFYKVGEIMGIDALSNWANKFKISEATEIDLPAETTGLVPTPAWKKAVKGERWFLGNTYHLSIGQGDLLLTPIRANTIISVIANNGIICNPRININSAKNCKDLNISQETINQVKNGLIKACQPGGTAFPFFDFNHAPACKTGTAETGNEDETHAWFTLFAPIDNPKLIMTVLVEKGGGGSDVAAPIAREVFDFYFNP